MHTNFKIRAPPRPKFPSSCIPIIEQASHYVDSFLSRLFETLEQPEPLSFGIDASLDQVRSYFEALDQQNRSAYLRIEILQESLKRAKEVCEHHIRFRKDQWSEFERKETQTSRWAQLPLEVVSDICNLHSGNNYRGLQERFASWGDLHLKTNTISLTASEAPNLPTLIRKSRRLELYVDDTGSIASACGTTERWTRFSIPSRDDAEETLSHGVEWLSTALEQAKPILSNSEELGVYFLMEFRGFTVTAVPNGEHTACSSCSRPSKGNYAMSKCKVAYLPLALLPFIGPSLINRAHLSIKLPTADDYIGPDFGLGHYFHHVSLEQLQTLRIEGPPSYSLHLLERKCISNGPIFRTPALKCLVVAVYHLNGSAVAKLLRHLNCTKLESAIICDVFDLPLGVGGSYDFHSQPILDGFQEMTENFNENCKELKRLSFYVCDEYTPDIDQWDSSEVNPANIVHDLLSTLYKTLSEGKEVLPTLKYLSIPFDPHCLGTTRWSSFWTPGHDPNTHWERWRFQPHSRTTTQGFVCSTSSVT